MKKVIVVLGFVFCFVGIVQSVLAQNSAIDKIEEYSSICIDARESYIQKNSVQLIDCAHKIKNLKEDIRLLDDRIFVSLQPEKEINIKGHLVFLDTCLINKANGIIDDEITEFNLHELYRETGIGNKAARINLVNKVIPASSTMRYKVGFVNFVKILVVPEVKKNLDIVVKNEANEIITTGTTNNAQYMASIEFNADLPAYYTIEITNNEMTDICCAITTN